MQDLGNAINESLSDSDRIAEAIGEIKRAGYDVFLVLEATIGFNKREEGEGEDEELIEQCLEVIRSEQKASVSLLQRRLKIGYGRAARIMDVLEERGYVGPSKGAEPRDILIDLDGEGKVLEILLRKARKRNAGVGKVDAFS